MAQRTQSNWLPHHCGTTQSDFDHSAAGGNPRPSAHRVKRQRPAASRAHGVYAGTGSISGFTCHSSVPPGRLSPAKSGPIPVSLVRRFPLPTGAQNQPPDFGNPQCLAITLFAVHLVPPTGLPRPFFCRPADVARKPRPYPATVALPRGDWRGSQLLHRLSRHSASPSVEGRYSIHAQVYRKCQRNAEDRSPPTATEPDRRYQSKGNGRKRKHPDSTVL